MTATVTKKFGIWITNTGMVGVGWTETAPKDARADQLFDSVQEAHEWAKTYTGYKASEVRSAIERTLFANEY